MGRRRLTGCGGSCGRKGPTQRPRGLWGGGDRARGPQWGSDPLGAPSWLQLWGGAVGRGDIGHGVFPMGFVCLWVPPPAGSVGWRMSITGLPNGVCPFVGCDHSPGCGVALWGVGDIDPEGPQWGLSLPEAPQWPQARGGAMGWAGAPPDPLLGRGRGMLWGRGTHHGGPQWGSVPSWCPIMAPRVGWCCGAEDTDPGGLQWGRSSAGVPLRLRAVLWGGWVEVTPPHCWGRRGLRDAAPMGLQWGLCPRGGPIMAPRVGWWASIPEVSNGVSSPPGVGPAVVPSVGRGYGVDGVTLSPIAGEGERRGNAARKGGWH